MARRSKATWNPLAKAVLSRRDRTASRSLYSLLIDCYPLQMKLATGSDNIQAAQLLQYQALRAQLNQPGQ